MKRVEIFNDNYSALGFGDTINKLSNLYRQYEDEDVEFLFHSKRKVFDNLIFLKNFCFEEPKRKKILIDSDQFLRSNKEFKLINHTYWPTKISWNNTKKYIAINFYTVAKKVHILSKKYDWHEDIERCKLFFESHKLSEKYSTIELSAIDNDRGHRKIIENGQQCLEYNMNILSNCSLFVSSEGGMTHLSRAMRVPTVIFFKKDNHKFYKFLQEFVDKKIQKLVHSTDEMINSIDYFLRYDKFN